MNNQELYKKAQNSYKNKDYNLTLNYLRDLCFDLKTNSTIHQFQPLKNNLNDFYDNEDIYDFIEDEALLYDKKHHSQLSSQQVKTLMMKKYFNQDISLNNFLKTEHLVIMENNKLRNVKDVDILQLLKLADKLIKVNE